MAKYSRFRACWYVMRSYLKFIITGRSLDYPYKIQIQTHTACNGRCVFCPYPYTAAKSEHGIMESALYNKIVDELGAESLTSEVLYELHNEPLMDDRTFSLIENAKTKNERKLFTLVTNGQLIQNYNLDEIKQSGLDKLVISLNAHTPETYESLSGGMKYSTVRENIERIIVDAELKSKLTLSFVIVEKNAAEVKTALRFWKNSGVSTRSFEISNRSGTLKNYEIARLKKGKIKRSKIEYLWSRLLDFTFRFSGCYLPFMNMTVLFNGDVIICCNDWSRNFIAGNLKKSSIKDIWNSPEMNSARRMILRKRYSEILTCKNCSKAS